MSDESEQERWTDEDTLDLCVEIIQDRRWSEKQMDEPDQHRLDRLDAHIENLQRLRGAPEGAGEIQEALSRVTPELIREHREECSKVFCGWPEAEWAQKMDDLLRALEQETRRGVGVCS